MKKMRALATAVAMAGLLANACGGSDSTSSGDGDAGDGDTGDGDTGDGDTGDGDTGDGDGDTGDGDGDTGDGDMGDGDGDGAPSCSEGQDLCSDVCTDLDSDRLNCGMCGEACDAGSVCEDGDCVANCSSDRTECDGGCVDTMTDPLNCGACGDACDFAGADGACLSGECVFVRCQEGFANCDGSPDNGCERDTENDRRHCGGCDERCELDQTCDAGECTGGVTTSPGSVSGDNFSVVDLSKTSCSVVDHEPQSGDDRSGIGVTPNQFFIVGDADTAILSSSDLMSPSSVGAVLNGIVGDLKAGKVYLMTDSTDQPLTGGGSTVERVVELDATGMPTGSPVNLSQALTADGGGMVFSGPGFFVLYSDDNTTAHRIDFATGTVTELSTTLTVNNCDNYEGWADYGIAEYYGGEVHLLYPTCDGIARVHVSDGSSETVLQDATISDLHSFTFEPTSSRWYWHHEGYSVLGDVDDDENSGYCEALWTDSACGPDRGVAECDSACVDVSSDPDHCGACDNACGAGEVCTDGVCDTCAENLLTDCDGVCIDTFRDAENCGACGEECGGETPYCVLGECSDASPSCEGTGDTSGVFTIVPESDPIDVYCENSDLGGQGGGWTLLGVFTNNDAVNSWTPYGTAWTQATTFGDATDPTINADAKSAAFNELPIDQLAIVRDGVVQVVTSTSCLGEMTLLSAMQVNSESDADCARSCPLEVQAGDWIGQDDQGDELAFRCRDDDDLVSIGGYSVSVDDNSMITTIDNDSNADTNFGLGAGEGGFYPDWDNLTDDSGDDGDTTQILLFGR